MFFRRRRGTRAQRRRRATLRVRKRSSHWARSARHLRLPVVVLETVAAVGGSACRGGDSRPPHRSKNKKSRCLRQLAAAAAAAAAAVVVNTVRGHRAARHCGPRPRTEYSERRQRVGLVAAAIARSINLPARAQVVLRAVHVARRFSVVATLTELPLPLVSRAPRRVRCGSAMDANVFSHFVQISSAGMYLRYIQGMHFVCPRHV